MLLLAAAAAAAACSFGVCSASSYRVMSSIELSKQSWSAVPWAYNGMVPPSENPHVQNYFLEKTKAQARESVTNIRTDKSIMHAHMVFDSGPK